MSSRSARRARKGLDRRQSDYDSTPAERRKGFNRPGSLNPKKNPTRARKR